MKPIQANPSSVKPIQANQSNVKTIQANQRKKGKKNHLISRVTSTPETRDMQTFLFHIHDSLS